MYDKSACAEQVVENLSRLITMTMVRVANEERYPESNPDESDRIIAEGTSMVSKLICMRTEFEYLMSGMIPIMSDREKARQAQGFRESIQKAEIMSGHV